MSFLERFVVHDLLLPGFSAWSILAKAPAIPALKELYLDMCSMLTKDFTTFVSKHCSTLTLLTISQLYLYDATKEDVAGLYERLSQAPNIEVYRQQLLYLDEERVGMPGPVSCPFLDDEEDENGFVAIHQTNRIRWKGHCEVTRALGVMAAHMRS